MTAMVFIGMMGRAQVNGVESYIQTDDFNVLIKNNTKLLDVNDKSYSFFVINDGLHGNIDGYITESDIKTIVSEFDRILKLNGLDLNSYNRYIVVNENTSPSRDFTLESLLKKYKAGMFDGFVAYTYNINGMEAMLSMDNNEIGFTIK
jgi:ubiquinone/menaquinone biosynthesis C-methylase UbiE